MDHILQLDEFFVEGGSQNRSHVLLHITEPSTEAEKSKGYFFAVTEVSNGEPSYLEELQSTISEIETYYYEQTHPDNTTRLETILEKINRERARLITPGTALNCLVGVLYGTQIIFSFHGEPLIFLFYKNRKGTYQRLNLSTYQEGEQADTNSLFSQLIQGKVSPEDFLFISTTRLGDYFSPDRLEKIITTRSARQSAEHFQRILGELHNGVSFGGLIVHLGKPPVTMEKRIRPTVELSSENSITRIFNTEQQTAQTLSSSVWPGLATKAKNLLQAAANKATKYSRKPTAEPREQPLAAEISSHHKRTFQRVSPITTQERLTMIARTIADFLLLAGKLLWRGISALAFLLAAFVTALTRLFGMLFLVCTNYQNRRRAILENWSRQWSSYKHDFQNLPALTKVLAGTALVLLLIFVGSVVFIRARQKTAAATAQFSADIETIQAKRDSAESALLYQDEAAALAELNAANALLAALPCSVKENQPRCTAEQVALQELLSKVRHLNSETSTIVASWPNGAHFSGMVKLGNNLLAFTPERSEIGVYSLLSKEASTATVTGGGFVAAAVPKENDYALFLTSRGELYRVTPDDLTLKKIDVSFPTEDRQMSSMVVYNRRLYTLDLKNNQIFKHDATAAGFGRGTAWIKDQNVNLNQGVSIAIDGDVFVAGKKGSVSKFTGGNFQPFQLATIDPTLSSAAKIWSYVDLNYLYVLDPTGKRLLIFNKDGRLYRQIVSPSFINPTDILIDEPGKSALVADGNNLLQVALPL